MLAIRTVLVPVVLSENCACSARYAARLSKEFGSRLVFLHVGGENGRDTLEDFVFEEIGITDHESVVLDGDPAERIESWRMHIERT